jgi:uncharacterized protein
VDEGNTLPFIARYRKESPRLPDDTVLRDLIERLTALRNLSPPGGISSSLKKLEKWTEEPSCPGRPATMGPAGIQSTVPYSPKLANPGHGSPKEKPGTPAGYACCFNSSKAQTPKCFCAVSKTPSRGVNTAEEALQGP